ncbi:hypothetical protein ILUMI_23661 [Ignelater luminosus]|uniref:THAP9-like helix-turn-helix domain-containing protein n=1 Tax=Ignelater luminosus TaxID=2038154 RepID=A0A8K0FWU7_IGNLU|nr:hypothetical protein ILUMI_23661 [Ignelater luminosus]
MMEEEDKKGADQFGTPINDDQDEDHQLPSKRRKRYENQQISLAEPAQPNALSIISNGNTPPRQQRKRINPSQPTPRTERKLKKYKRLHNVLRCNLFRRKRIARCICGNDLKYKNSRYRMAQILKEAKNMLSKEAYALFATNLSAVFTNKHNRRYTDDMKQLCLTWYYSSPKGYRTIAKTINLPPPRILRNWAKNLKMKPRSNKDGKKQQQCIVAATEAGSIVKAVVSWNRK